MRGGTDFEEAEGRETGGARIIQRARAVGWSTAASGRGSRTPGQGQTAGAAPNFSAGRYLSRLPAQRPGETRQQQRRIEEPFQLAFNDPLVVCEISLTGFYLEGLVFVLYEIE